MEAVRLNQELVAHMNRYEGHLLVFCPGGLFAPWEVSYGWDTRDGECSSHQCRAVDTNLDAALANLERQLVEAGVLGE